MGPHTAVRWDWKEPNHPPDRIARLHRAESLLLLAPTPWRPHD